MSVLLGSDGVDFHVGLGFGRLDWGGRFYYSNVVFRVVLVGNRVLLRCLWQSHRNPWF
jgi:hypothetical protein